jgi:hypothetical protein
MTVKPMETVFWKIYLHMAVFSVRIGSDEDPIALTMGEDAASLLHTSSFLRQLESWKYSNPSYYINLQHHYVMDHNITTVPTYIYRALENTVINRRAYSRTKRTWGYKCLLLLLNLTESVS